MENKELKENMNSADITLSIVMPVRNEEAIIGKVIDEYCRLVTSQFKKSEFIIINDCSSDRTQVIINDLVGKYSEIKAYVNEFRLGHGPTLLRGLSLASMEYVFFADGDYNHDPSDFWKLFKYSRPNTAVIGQRVFFRYKDILRVILSHLQNILIFLLFGIYIYDPNVAFKLYPREILFDILKDMDAYKTIPSALISLMTVKKGIPLYCIPIKHFESLKKKEIAGFNALKFSFRAFKDLIALRINLSDEWLKLCWQHKMTA